MIFRLLALGVVILLPSFSAEGAPITATDALGAMRKAVAYVGREATAAGLDARKPEDQAFLSAVKHADQSVRAANKSLAARDPAYFDALDRATVAAAEVDAAWKISGLTNPKIDAAVNKLNDVSDVSRTYFGKQASRKARGGSLDANETAVLAKAKAEAEKLRKALAELKGTSRNKALNAELDKTDRELAAALAAGATVDGLLGLLWGLDVTDQRWRAWNRWGARNDPYAYQRWRPYDNRFRESNRAVRSARSRWPAYGNAVNAPVNVPGAAVAADIPVSDAELDGLERDMDGLDVEDPAELQAADADGLQDVDEAADGVDGLANDPNAADADDARPADARGLEDGMAAGDDAPSDVGLGPEGADDGADDPGGDVGGADDLGGDDGGGDDGVGGEDGGGDDGGGGGDDPGGDAGGDE